MIKKLAIVCGLLAGLSWGTLAQETPENPEGKKAATSEFELSAGYAYRSYEIQKGTTIGMDGWYGSVDYNYKRWIGLDAEILGSYKNRGLVGNTDIYAFLVGPRVYPLGHRRLSPFGYVLFGAGRYSNAIPAFGGFPAANPSDTAFAWEAGGGAHLYLRKNLGAAVQVGTGRTHFGADNVLSSQTNTRVSVGIVYRFSRQ